MAGCDRRLRRLRWFLYACIFHPDVLVPPQKHAADNATQSRKGKAIPCRYIVCAQNHLFNGDLVGGLRIVGRLGLVGIVLIDVHSALNPDLIAHLGAGVRRRFFCFRRVWAVRRVNHSAVFVQSCAALVAQRSGFLLAQRGAVRRVNHSAVFVQSCAALVAQRSGFLLAQRGAVRRVNHSAVFVQRCTAFVTQRSVIRCLRRVFPIHQAFRARNKHRGGP